MRYPDAMKDAKRRARESHNRKPHLGFGLLEGDFRNDSQLNCVGNRIEIVNGLLDHREIDGVFHAYTFGGIDVSLVGYPVPSINNNLELFPCSY